MPHAHTTVRITSVSFLRTLNVDINEMRPLVCLLFSLVACLQVTLALPSFVRTNTGAQNTNTQFDSRVDTFVWEE